jgi:type II secretory pathway pseudopilin PulG
MQQPLPIRKRPSEDGFLLVAMICAIAVILIFLAVAAPIVAKDMQREREIEMIHRGNQYVRAIRVYYRKNGAYPPSIDVLLKSNNMRYLRQNYVDPMTGKDDWRIIHVGENQTQVPGFFGEPLSGLLGAAGGLGAGIGGSPQTTAGPGGSSGATGASGATGSTGASGSNDATSFNGSGGGPIMGVSSLSTKESIISIHGKTTYDTWEFIYDPRIELLYAKSKVSGGGGGTDAASSSDMGFTPAGGSAGATGSTGSTGATGSSFGSSSAFGGP